MAAGYAIALSAGSAMPAAVALLVGGATVIPGMLLGFWVIALCTHVSPRQGIAFLFLVHAATGLGYSIAWSGLIVGEIRLFQTKTTFEDFLRTGLAWQLVMGVVVYAVLVGMTYARLARRGEEVHRLAAERAETLRLQAELSALRARLDPHFLFNVLQTLGALIGDRPRDAQQAVEHLAALLERRLRGEARDDLTDFSDELLDVREYLALEQLRLGARLKASEQIEPATHTYQWPRFTLQPLVENAIRHGIAPRASGGTVTISSVTRNGQWCVEVKDDGKGIASPQSSAPDGIGLRVVRDRLRLHFGERASISLSSDADAGTTVTIVVDILAMAGDDE